MTLGFKEDRLVIVQRPEASASKQVPTWSSFSYVRLGWTKIYRNGRWLAVEVLVSALLNVLRAFETQTHACFSVLKDHIRIVAGSSQMAMEGPEIMSHEVLATVAIEEMLCDELLSEPIISRPTISFSLGGINDLRQRLSKLSEIGNVGLSVSHVGDLHISVVTTMLSVTMKSSVRVLNNTASEGDNIGVTVKMEQLLRVLSHALYFPISSSIVAIIPNRVLVFSVTIGGIERDSGETVTFFIPSIECIN